MKEWFELFTWGMTKGEILLIFISFGLGLVGGVMSVLIAWEVVKK